MGKKVNIKARFSESLELPKEAVLGVPTVKITGTNEIYIENHKGILEYGNEYLRINSSLGIIKITGRNLQIKEISQEEILINGIIISLEFVS